ncbi:hypothetical protein FRB93_012729 [Tulasnella sp. JGI-2019a]|nr:hypothetical protein FRB93_012729 [Tulasnella sp. JGI-2019a]
MEALGVSEIVNQILQQVNKSTQASAARTCRFWSCIALDWLWRDMESLCPLFQLLSPLEAHEREWFFSSNLLHTNWGRFDSYAGRIRSIAHYDRYEFRGLRLATSSLFDEIDTWRPTRKTLAPLLRNVTNITWTASNARTLPLVLHLISLSLTTLEISCARGMTTACASLLNDLTQRNLSLVKFVLSADDSNLDYTPNLSAFLRSQKRLVTASLPPFSATKEVVNALGELPSLKKYTGWSVVKYRMPVESGMCFSWEPGTFKILEDLAFHAHSLVDASRTLQGAHRSLRSLQLTCRPSFTNDGLLSLTSTLASVHHSLNKIALNLFAINIMNVSDPSGNSISLCYILPLLQCRGLSSVRLSHKRTLAYSEDDIVTMAAAWPGMVVLELFADPTTDVTCDMGQPLQSIHVFIREFPGLKRLALFVNILTDTVPEVSKAGMSGLANLEVLDFGTSPPLHATNPRIQRSISLYLSSITTPGIDISGRRSSCHVRAVATTEEENEEYEFRLGFWLDIGTRVELVHAGRKSMAEEISELSLQNKALSEKVRKLELLQEAPGRQLTSPPSTGPVVVPEGFEA